MISTIKNEVRRMLYGHAFMKPIGQWVEIEHFTNPERTESELFLTKTYISDNVAAITQDKNVANNQELMYLTLDEKYAIFTPETPISKAGGDIIRLIDKAYALRQPDSYERQIGNNTVYTIIPPVIPIYQDSGEIAYYICKMKEGEN